MTGNTEGLRQQGGGATLDRDYYRLLYESAEVAMIATDRSLQIRTWNAAAGRMFGASAPIMIDSAITAVIPFAQREPAERVLQRVIDEGVVAHFDFQHRDARGKPRTLAVSLSPIADDDGKRIGALASLRDITWSVGLEAEVARRKKMASLGQMAGAVAHHFNNILGGAVTSVDFALASDDAELHRRTLQYTSEALARAAKLMESLLAFAEGDQRHDDLCDLTELIIQTAEYLEPELASAGITLDLKLRPIPITPVPRAQIVTVLENIVHNAVDAMPEGGTTTIETSSEKGVVTLSIHDTGCGMDEESQEHIFEPFYSTKGGGGSILEHHPGLGLAVAHGILEVLGHKISLSSALGKGTMVTIRIAGKPVGDH